MIVTAMETRIYRVPESNLFRLNERIAKLNKRAHKLNLALIVLATVKTEDVEIMEQGEPSGRFRRYHHITFEGQTPKLAGWQLQAVLERIPEIEGNIVRCLPNVSLPVSYRTQEPICEHCKLSRRRLETFVLLNGDGRLIQVGRNCLADFLGGANPEDLLSSAEYLLSIDACLEEAEDDGYSGTREKEYVSLLHVLEVTSMIIRIDGWVSRKTAQEQDKNPTSAAVQGYLFAKDREKDFPSYQYSIVESDTACAESAIEWARTLNTRSELDDYLYNLSVLGKTEKVDTKSFGLACSIVSSHQREMNKNETRKREAEQGAKSEYFGTIGQREVFTLTVKTVINSATDYGPLFIHKLEDVAGNHATWFSSSESLEIGKTHQLTATVKKHEEYKGIKQTILTRCAVFVPKRELSKEDKKTIGKLKRILKTVPYGDETYLTHKTIDGIIEEIKIGEKQNS